MRWNILIDAENNRFSTQTSVLLAAMFIVSMLPRDFSTYAIWFTMSRAAFELIENCKIRSVE